jgi:hypothetical protein
MRALIIASLAALLGVGACDLPGAVPSPAPTGAEAASPAASAPPKSIYSVVPEGVRL